MSKMARIDQLGSCIKELLGGLSIVTLSERKRLQKTIYLLQEFGVDLGYRFGWYISGPYSSELANDAFMLAAINQVEGNSGGNVRQLDQLASERMKALKTFLGSDINSPETLELLASLHFLQTKAFTQDRSKEGIIKTLRERKPQFTELMIENAWARLAESGLAKGSGNNEVLEANLR